jgi:hypothetical protein
MVTLLPHLFKLLRTISSRPQLAAYTTNLCLHGTEFNPGISRRKIPEFSVFEDDLDASFEFIRRTGFSFANHWIEEFRDDKPDALVALLLAQLSNIRILHLDDNFLQQSEKFGMVLRTSICEAGITASPPFSISRMYIPCSAPRAIGRATSRAKTPWMSCHFSTCPSSNQHLHASIENPLQFTWPGAHPPEPANLTSLHLTTLHEVDIRQVLAVTKKGL